MRNIRAMALAALLVSLLGGMLYELTRPAEPEFQGTRLGDWLAEAGKLRLNPGDTQSVQAEQEQIENAVRQIGTNAVPRLLTMLCAKDGPIKKSLCSWLLACGVSTLRPTTDNELHVLALLGFNMLGPIAQGAVPALVDLLGQGEGETAFLAARALGRIGPAASNAVPALIMSLDSRDFAVRYMATNSLRRIQPTALLNPPVAGTSA